MKTTTLLFKSNFICKRVIIFVLSFFISSLIFSQSGSVVLKIDSLSNLIKTDQEDTNKVKHLNELGWELMYQNTDTSIILEKQALELALTISASPLASQKPLLKKAAEKGIAKSYNNLGVSYWLIGNFTLSLSYHFKALEIREALGDKKEISASLGNIGSVYSNQGNYPKAVEYYLKALKLSEELGDKHSMAVDYGNLGVTFGYQGDYPRALECYFKALKINIEIKSKEGMEINLGHIGNVYLTQGNYSLALEYFLKALKISEESGNKYGMAENFARMGNVCFSQQNYAKALEYYFKALKLDEETGYKYDMATVVGNIGSVYYTLTDYPKALEYFLKALSLSKELGDQYSIAVHLGNIGSLYIMENKYKEAEESLLEALKISDQIGALYLIKANNEVLSDLYSRTKRYELAYKHHVLFTDAKDSLFNDEKSKDIGRLESKHEMEIAEMERKKIVEEELKAKNEKRQRKNTLQYSGIIVLLLLIGLLITLLGFVKVSPVIARAVTFFAFLLFFEFLLVLLDPTVDRFSGGEPAYKLLFNAVIAGCIFPIHALFERILKQKLLKKG